MYSFLEKDLQWLIGEIKRLETQEEALQNAGAHPYILSRVQIPLKYKRQILSQGSIVLPARGNTIGIGSVVITKCFLGKGLGKKRQYEEYKNATYEIGSYLVPPDQSGRISYHSLIGRELLGLSVGQTRNINPGMADSGVDYNLNVLEIINSWPLSSS